MQLFIGRIPKSYTYDELFDYFSKIGKIKSLRILDGYGFISFEERSDAIKALDMKHCIHGHDIVIEESQNKRDDYRRDDHRRDDFKRDDHRRDDFKRDDYRRDDYKRDDYKGDDYRKDDYRKDDYRKDDYRKDDYRRDDYRRDDYRRDDYRRDDYRRDDYRRDDYDDRRRDYDRYDDRRRDFDNKPRDYDREGDRRRDYDDRRLDYERGDRSPRRNARRCDYCDRCPTHGIDKGYTPQKRYAYDEPAQNVPKVVLMGICPETQADDVKEFIQQYKLESSYIRITNNKKYAIIEFKTMEEKERALVCLENKELLGNIVQARTYKTNKREFEDERKRYRRSDDEERKYNDNQKAEVTEKTDQDVTQNENNKTEQKAEENEENKTAENKKEEQKVENDDELYGDLS